MRAALLVSTCLLLLLAGCLGPTSGPSAAQEPGAPTDDASLESPPSTDDEAQPSSGAPERKGRVGAGILGPAPIEVLRMPFHITVQGGKSTLANVIEEDPYLDLAPTGATALVLELAWDSDVFDLDPNLIFDGGCPLLEDPVGCTASGGAAHWVDEGDDGNYWVKGGSTGAPDSPVRLEVGAEALTAYGCDEGCSAFARAIVKDVAVEVTGELVVSVFRGVPVPDGYSALTPG